MEGVDILMGVVAPYFNFIVFFILAIKFFKKPLLAMTSQKKMLYETMVAEASKAKEEALQKQHELDGRLAKLDAEIKTIRDNARDAALLEADHMIEKTKRAVEHMTAESHRLAEALLKKAKEQLTAEMIQQMSQMVSKRLEAGLEPERQKALLASRVGVIKNLRREA